MSVQLIDLTLELLILGGQRAVGFLGFAELGRDKLCCLIIASLSGLLGLSHSVLQTSILRLELLHLTGKIGDLRIKVGHVRTQRLGGLTAGYRLTSKSLDGFRDLIKEVIDLVDIITFLESNSLEGMLPNILRRQQSINLAPRFGASPALTLVSSQNAITTPSFQNIRRGFLCQIYASGGSKTASEHYQNNTFQYHQRKIQHNEADIKINRTERQWANIAT